ncbi:uncharacterized protein LOC134213729 [Armigeres subalbatus]|uniref:uncharacterized protein LOC134213729 n=1 Tax=Armigeres subalbatus TaxID=124917 RepID=UPI002ED63674
MTSKTTLMNNLPLELLDRIFSYLPLSDRKSSSLVCRLWSEQVFSGRFLRNIELKLIMGWGESERLRKTARRYRNVFILAPFALESCEYNFGFIVKVLDELGADLESFHCVINFTEEQLWYLIIRAPNLKQLIVGMDSRTLSQQNYSLPELRYLRSSGPLANVFQIKCPSSYSLSTFCTNFTERSNVNNSIMLLRRLAPDLKSLQLYSKRYYIPIEELQFPNVEVLRLGGRICKTGDGALRTFFGGFKLLKDVNLGFNVKEHVLDMITNICPGIVKLHLENDVLKPGHFRSLERLKCLKTLSLIGSVDSRVVMECKPLESVNCFCLHMSHLNCEMSIVEDFRQLLPNVIDMNVTLSQISSSLFATVFICVNFPHLKRLTISNNIAGSYSLDEFRHLDRLEELTLRFIPMPVMLEVSKKFLKRLRFECCSWLTDGYLSQLPEKYPNLKYLELEECRQVSPKGVEVIRSRLPNCVIHCVQSDTLGIRFHFQSLHFAALS